MKSRFLYSLLVVLGLSLYVSVIGQSYANAQDRKAPSLCYGGKSAFLMIECPQSCRGYITVAFKADGTFDLTKWVIKGCKLVKQTKQPAKTVVSLQCGKNKYLITLNFKSCKLGDKTDKCGNVDGTIGTCKLTGYTYIPSSSGPENLNDLPDNNSILQELGIQ